MSSKNSDWNFRWSNASIQWLFNHSKKLIKMIRHLCTKTFLAQSTINTDTNSQGCDNLNLFQRSLNNGKLMINGRFIVIVLNTTFTDGTINSNLKMEIHVPLVELQRKIILLKNIKHHQREEFGFLLFNLQPKMPINTLIFHLKMKLNL
jgi:hypothetical protein